MEYFDQESGEKYIPYVIEPSLGADRVTLAFLCNAYDEEIDEKGDTRTVLHLHPALAPFKAAVLPLSKKLSDKAMEIKNDACQVTLWLILTIPALSVNAIAARTRSELRIA